MGAGKLRKSLDQEQATPRASFRRAGHAAHCDMGHFAREKGYKAALRATHCPLGPPLAGYCQLRNNELRKDTQWDKQKNAAHARNA